MKLAGAGLAGFLRNPQPGVVAALVFGPDDGLVRERGAALVRAVIGGEDDPFRLALLGTDQVAKDPARLTDEALSISLLGGRRVVRIRDAADAVSAPLAAVLDRPEVDALIVLEAGDLPPRSSLRKLVEAHPRAAAIGCYPDGPDEIGRLVRETLARDRIAVDDEAVEYLVDHLGSDRAVTRQELEKLALHAGAGGRVDLATALASVGDSSRLTLDTLVDAAFDGAGAAAEQALLRLFAEGEQPVRLVTVMMRHAQRLHLCGLLVAAGRSADAAIGELRPPPRKQAIGRFKAQLRAWPPPRCGRLLQSLTRLERDCKTTGLPADLLCRRAFASFGRPPR